MSTSTKTTTDFTQREPELPKLQKAWVKAQKDEAVRNPRKHYWSSATEAKRFWNSVNDEWFKVVLTADIRHGNKVVARKGDIAWAYYQPEKKGCLLVPSNLSQQALKRLRSPKYIVRIPSVRKLAERPHWDNELASINYSVELNNAKVVSPRGRK